MVLIVKKNISNTNDIGQDLEVNKLTCDNLEITNGGSITLPPSSIPPSSIQPGTVTVDDMTKLSEINGDIVDTQRTQTVQGLKTFQNNNVFDGLTTFQSSNATTFRLAKFRNNNTTPGADTAGIAFENSSSPLEMFIYKPPGEEKLCFANDTGGPNQTFDATGVNLDSGSQAYKINGTNVLTTNTLGSGILNSSLQNIGTLNNLRVGAGEGPEIVDIKDANPTVNIEATTTNATLQLTGPDKRVSFDSAFDLFNSQSNPNDFEIRNSSNVPVFRLNGLTGSLGVGAPSVGAPSNVALNIDSNFGTKTIQLPAFTTAERNAFTSPNNGMLLYNTTTQVLEWYNGTSWQPINSISAPSGDIMGTTDTHIISGDHTYNDNSFTLQDDADNTKKANFQCSAITTATTRTYTMPDVTGELLTNNSTATVTNKTIDFANNTLANVVSTNTNQTITGRKLLTTTDPGAFRALKIQSLNATAGQDSVGLCFSNATDPLEMFIYKEPSNVSESLCVARDDGLPIMCFSDTLGVNLRTDTNSNYAYNINNIPMLRGTTNSVAVGNNSNNLSTAGLVFVGQNAGNNVSVASITAIGESALSSSTNSTGLVAVGHECFGSITTGANNNTGCGHNVAQNRTGGVGCTFVGHRSGQNGSGNNNTGCGKDTLRLNTTGLLNSALGLNSLNNVTSGNNNTGLGANSGSTITTGGANICIGQNSDVSSATANNRIAIGNNCTNAVNNSFKVSNPTVPITSALINVDTFQIQPNSGNNDAILSLKRGGGLLEDLRLETRTGGLFIRNESATTDLVQINNSVTDVLVGNLNIQSGNLTRGGVQVVGAQQPAISDPAANNSANNAAIISILGALRNHGLIST